MSQPEEQAPAEPSAGRLPTGTVTFLFTDIAGSTKLWEQAPDAMRAALARHDQLLRAVVVGHGGGVFKTVGDSVCAAFATAYAAVDAALDAQAALAAEPWEGGLDLRVRMALHTGEAEERDRDYFGPALNRVARLMAAGHGGQTLVSDATRQLVRDALPPGVTLADLGEHQLRDMARPEQIYQLGRPDLPAEFPPLAGLGEATPPNNLPQQLTSFIGRERELAAVRALLGRGRLVTLTGSGGGGKTRLSLQAAAAALDDYPAGVWLVELAPLSDPALVPQAVAEALGVRQQAGQPLTRTLADALGEKLADKRMLLVLDNCEHLLAAGAALAEALLRACPNLTLLTSSREALGIAGEQTYRVPPLAVPDLALPATPESLSGCESVRLFLDRAALTRSDFRLTAPNAPALASVCSRLDGIPLAIELAAARVRSLSVEEINNRLSSRFHLLTGGSRTALPRQQTLRALIDWSYSLLSGPERRLLRRVSVFAGGWTLDAAEQVCADPAKTAEDASEDAFEDWETLDLLGSLVDKSIAQAETQEGRTRYRLLESVRQYAREKLAEAGETDALRTRHRDWCLAFAEAPYQNGRGYALWWQDAKRMATEGDNLRAALAWCEESRTRGTGGADEADAAFRLLSALFEWWSSGEQFHEGRDHLPLLLARQGTGRATRARAAAFYYGGRLALDISEYAQAVTLHEEALATAREIGDEAGMAAALQDLAWVAAAQGDYARAHALADECLALCLARADDRAANGARHLLGLIAEYEGDFDALYSYCVECLDYSTRVGDSNGRAWNQQGLAYAALRRGEHDTARRLLGESLRWFQEMDRGAGQQRALDRFGELAAAEGKDLPAVRLFAAAEAARTLSALTLNPREREDYARLFDVLRLRLGSDRFDAAWAEGAALSLPEAVALALEASEDAPE